MAEETEVEIEIAAPDVADTPAPKVVTAEEGIEELRRKLAEAETSRIEADRRAREAETRAVKATADVEDANLTLVKNAIETVKRDQSIQKQAYKAALASGDYDAAADAQELMASSAARLLHLENGKTAMETAPKKPQVADNPVERLASQLSPRSADWVRRNPQYATDPRLLRKMEAAHNLAVADGIAPDTDAYFESVETTLRMRKPAVAEPVEVMSEAAAPVRARSSPVAAPVSRDTMNGTRPTVVRLSAQEREMAEMMGMKPEDYARNKQMLIREGRLN